MDSEIRFYLTHQTFIFDLCIWEDRILIPEIQNKMHKHNYYIRAVKNKTHFN